MRTNEEKRERKRTSILSSNFFQISSSTLHYYCQLDDDVLALNNYVFVRKKLEINLLGIDDVYVCGVRKKTERIKERSGRQYNAITTTTTTTNNNNERLQCILAHALLLFYYKRRLFTQFGDEF
jgi:hypothetical protein